MARGGQTAGVAAPGANGGPFDPRSLGYGAQWAVRLTLLFADTLFVGRSDRGADTFNDVFMLAILAAYAAAFLALRGYGPGRAPARKTLALGAALQAGLGVAGVGLVALASYLPALFAPLSTAAAACLGLGLGLGTYEWVYLFFSRGPEAARPDLIVSWLLGTGLFALLAVMPPLPRLAAMAVLVVGSVVAERGFMRATPGACEPEEREGAGAATEPADPRRAGRVLAALIACVWTIGFIYGMSGPIQLSGAGASTGDTGLLVGHLGTLLLAALAASLIILAFPRRLNLLACFLVGFTLDITAAVALPFAGEGYLSLCAGVFGLVNRIAGMIVLYSCATLPDRGVFFRTAPFMLGASSVGVLLGVAVGGALFGAIADSYLALMVVALVIMYVLFMVLTVSLVLRGWRGASSGDAGEPGGSIASSSTNGTGAGRSDDPLDAMAGLYGLSEREREVLALLAKGRGTPFVAEQLGLSQNTVKAYARSLYKKLGVHSREELMDLVEGRGR